MIIDGALWCRIDPSRSLRGAQRGCRLFSKLPWIQLDNCSVKLVARAAWVPCSAHLEGRMNVCILFIFSNYQKASQHDEEWGIFICCMREEDRAQAVVWSSSSAPPCRVSVTNFDDCDCLLTENQHTRHSCSLPIAPWLSPHSFRESPRAFVTLLIYCNYSCTNEVRSRIFNNFSIAFLLCVCDR